MTAQCSISFVFGLNNNEFVVVFVCEDGLMRAADPLFIEACQHHASSRYYNCDIAIANDTEIVNNRTWLTCPTFIGI